MNSKPSILGYHYFLVQHPYRNIERNIAKLPISKWWISCSKDGLRKVNSTGNPMESWHIDLVDSTSCLLYASCGQVESIMQKCHQFAA